MNNGANCPIPKIIVVDDDPIVRVLMADTLEDAGYNVLEAGDGREALQQVAQARPDLMVVDAVMPEIDGFALCRAVRKDPAAKHIPILMATGLDDDASVASAYDAGATDFISKPISWVNLTQRVQYLLRAAAAFEELRASEANSLAAKHAAEQANLAKTEFLATMGHELRTPLNAIIGFANMLRDCTVGAEELSEFATYIADSGASLLANVNDILDFARAEAGELALADESVELETVVSAAVAAVGGIAKLNNIAVRSGVEAGLPSLRGDAVRVQQVLVNLLSNAVKFSNPGGTVDIDVERLASGALEVTVTDRGVGIADADLPTALAPFGQVDSKAGRSYEGVGIGLPLTHRLVALHDGSLEIASAPQQGATVRVRFPPSRLAAAVGA